MEKSSQEKTAFGTPWGKYEFTTMPFGLVAAPSTFQRLMDQIFHDTHQYAVAYLDDIIVHSQTWDEHLYHLLEVFTRLQQARLKIKEKKCSFACNSCTYLGHVVGNGQVWPMEEKVKAVKEFKQPKTKKDVRAFLGLCDYYRRFITTLSPFEFDPEGNAKQSYLDTAVGDLISEVKRHADKLPSTEYTHLEKGIHTPNRCFKYWYWLRPKSTRRHGRRTPHCLWL